MRKGAVGLQIIEKVALDTMHPTCQHCLAQLMLRIRVTLRLVLVVVLVSQTVCFTRCKRVVVVAAVMITIHV